MNELFADTSGWAAGLVQQSSFHAQAVNHVAQAQLDGRRLVTTNYVLAELVAPLTSPLRVPRPVQIQFLTDLRKAGWVEIIHVDSTLDTAAWRLWQSRPDEEWSLVDCASFVVMRQRGLADALTTDHHFEQSGFVRMLK